MRKWKDLQMEVLGLVFSRVNGGTVIDLNNDDVREYVVEMPDAANYAFRDLCRITMPLVRKYEIVHDLPGNLLGLPADAMYVHETDPVIYEADGRSYTFEVLGPATVEVWSNNSKVETHEHDGRYLKRFSGVCDGKIKLVFTGAWPYTYRGVAVYALPYRDVPPYQSKMRYPMRKLAGDFMELLPRQFMRDGQRCGLYDWESDDTLVLDRDARGLYTVFYKAYPEPITAATPADYEIDLPDDIVDLAAYYIASRVIKEDDIQISTAYLNQYQVKREELQRVQTLSGKAEFYSAGGWY